MAFWTRHLKLNGVEPTTAIASILASQPTPQTNPTHE